MDKQYIMEMFRDTAYVRTGGSEEEKKAAEYIVKQCERRGIWPTVEEFEVPMAKIKTAKLTVDGKEIECRGYLCCGSGTVEGELYYLTESDPYSLSKCNGRIVLFDGYLGYWRYQELLKSGAVGFISYDGNVNFADNDIDQRELRSYVSNGEKIIGVNINAKDAVELVRNKAKRAKIEIEQDEYVGKSQNVVAELKGERDEVIVFTAHYDSTSLSSGAYDNMSGSVALVALAEHFTMSPYKYTLRFVWCGSEERGLLGSKAYCAAHEDELEKIVLNINLDMVGCIMGKFIACCTSESSLVSYLSYLGDELGFQIKPYQGVYSSDSTPFSDKGIPSVSFARVAPRETATIHNRYDTLDIISPQQMQDDIEFILSFAYRMAISHRCPVPRTIPDNMKEKLDEYLLRKKAK